MRSNKVADYYIDTIKRGCKRYNRTIQYNIDKKYMDYLIQKQQYNCALSGVNICLTPIKSTEQTASLDRIDSSKGYVEDNVQLVHKTINLMKWNIDNTEFIELCKIITNYNNRSNKQ